MIAKKIEKRAGSRRAPVLLFFIFAAGMALAGRLYYLQIVLGEHYQVWAQGLAPFSQKIDLAERGEIFFAGGQPLAINKDFPYCYGSPLNIKDKPQAASLVAQILGLGQNDLAEKFSRDSLYVLLKEKISESEAEQIQNAKIDGIYVARKKMRYYPQGDVAGQLAGFVDDDGNGRYGLEEYYDEELKSGQSIVINIDYNIQYKAQKLMAQAKENLGAAAGEAIVADPKTGAIIAMAEADNFNPNNYKEQARENIDIFKNDSCQSLFEPGSVFKAITMAAALNDGKVTPQTSYYDSGSLTVGPNTIYNYAHRFYGQQTMTNVLEHSVNTGAAFAQSRLGNQPFADYVEKFGVFEKTGIDLPETYSNNAEFKKGYAINYVTGSYGQGIWMTSIQLIRAYSALANGGRLVQPAIASDRRKNADESKTALVISPETSKTIAKMLASVVDNGFGKAAKVPGYEISGKTGTAQMSWSTLGRNERGYSDKTTQSFIGFLPSGDPQFLILIKLVAPNVNTAEYSAIPVFKELAQYVIYAHQLPPTREIKTTDTPVIPAVPAFLATTTASILPQSRPN